MCHLSIPKGRLLEQEEEENRGCNGSFLLTEVVTTQLRFSAAKKKVSTELAPTALL